jgi:hypothetical protein
VSRPRCPIRPHKSTRVFSFLQPVLKNNVDLVASVAELVDALVSKFDSHPFSPFAIHHLKQRQQHWFYWLKHNFKHCQPTGKDATLAPG